MRIPTPAAIAICGLAGLTALLAAADDATLTTVEGRHIVLRLRADDLRHLEDPEAWVAELDRAYEALADLVGARPFDGEKITILSVEEDPGGWAVAGNPIRWHRRHVRPTLRDDVAKGGWSFGIVHEISHDFDLDDSWNWNSALICNFKVDYVFQATKALVFFEGRTCDHADPESPRVADVHSAMEARRGYGADSRMLYGGWGKDAYHHKLTALVDDVGWDPVKRVFRWFNTLEPEQLARGKLGKRSLFFLSLEEQSGVAVVDRVIEWGFSQLTVEGAKNARAAARMIHDKEREWRAKVLDRPIRVAPGEQVRLRVELLARNPATFEKGLGTHPDSEFVYDLNGTYRRFESLVGVPGTPPAEQHFGSVGFEVIADGKTRYESPVLRGGGRYRRVVLDIAGVKELRLIVNDGGDGPWGDGCAWVDAKLTDAKGRVTHLSDLQPVFAKQGYGGLHKDECIDGEPLTFLYGPCDRPVRIVGRLGERLIRFRRSRDPMIHETTLRGLEEGTHLVRLRIGVGNGPVTQHELVTVIVE